MHQDGSLARNLRSLGLAGLLGLTLVATACGRVSGSIGGQVVDVQTGQPIAGAVILGVWTTYEGLPGLAHSKLVGLREVETDVAGRFELERPPGAYGGDLESVTVYKFGYIAWNNIVIYPVSERRQDFHVPARIMLERFPAGETRTRHIDFISGATRGGLSSRAEKFWSAVRREQLMR